MTREECARERVETGRPDPRIGIPDHYSTPLPVNKVNDTRKVA